ncbi:heparinase II/III family protein [Streptomyces sp. TS71-3]|uniref:heparinase II/III domain-containing protein n=1 Tax=Streptomyces sp. TS71-3 TaxID=2733862 RepID=UPI001B1ADA51|nr:heparinase II/III family protein [Streptomyces sp. TS71-3]GHJ42626.1 heparinase [Streptomyces sp. TS71-3]
MQPSQAPAPDHPGSASGGRLAGFFPPELVAARMPAIGKWTPVPPAGDRDAWRPADGVRERVLGAAAAPLGEPWPALPAGLFARFARDGDRSAHQSPVAARRARLARAVLAAAVAGDGAEPFLEEVMDGVWALCEETTWCWPAHDFRVLGEPGTLLPDPERPTLDLGAAGTCGLLALTDAITGDALDRLDPMVRRRLRHEVSDRVLRPYMERAEWGWFDGSTAKLNNWNPWIHSDLLLGTALTVKSPERRLALVGRIIEGLDNYLAAQPADGGCDEGPHYWWRAGASLFECLETLTSMLGTDAGVFGHPLIRAMARYPLAMGIGDGWVVNFADGPARLRETTPAVLHRYGRRTGQPDVSAHARALRGDDDAVLPGEGAPFDLRRVLDALFDPEWRTAPRTGFPLPAGTWLPDTQVLVSRAAGGSRKGLLLAAKGGTNDESHNHNDVGSFIVALDARPLIVDAGVGTYRKETFNRDRYTIWSMTSPYHNLPVVNGVAQAAGPPFRAAEVAARTGAGADELTLDIAGAYPDEARLRSWTRTLRLVRGPDEHVTVDDAWSSEGTPSSLALHLLVSGDLTLDGTGSATVTPARGRGVGVAWDATAFSASAEAVALDDPVFTRVWGPALHRLVLTALRPPRDGNHRLTVRPLPPGDG